MRFFTILLFITLLSVACSNPTPENLSNEVDRLIAEEDYSQAIELLENANEAETEANLSELREKAYLNYGLYLEYRGPEDDSMRDRMTSALEQYIKVLEINPDNQKARSEIKQIMGIYETMPDRTPGEEILEDLEALGVEY